MVAGIAALLMLALQVSGLSHIFPEEPGYVVQAEFSNVGALKVRARVSVAGVMVGRVSKITLEPGTYYAKVDLTIRPNHIDKLPGDTRASIMTAGLLGDNYIALTPGFDDEHPLREGSLIPLTNTDSALVLEQLISKFVAGQASKNDTEKAPQKEVEQGSKKEKHQEHQNQQKQDHQDTANGRNQ